MTFAIRGERAYYQLLLPLLVCFSICINCTKGYVKYSEMEIQKIHFCHKVYSCNQSLLQIDCETRTEDKEFAITRN